MDTPTPRTANLPQTMTLNALEKILAAAHLSNHGKMYEIACLNAQDNIANPHRYVITDSTDVNPTRGKQRLGRKDHALAYAQLAAEDGLPNTEVLDTDTNTWLS